MNRLQKKCLFVSAGVHSLLFLILLIGPAFISVKDSTPPPQVEILDLVDAKLIDAAFSGGGNPNATPPPPAPPRMDPPAPKEVQPQLKPKEPQVKPPEPKTAPQVEKKINPDSLEPATSPKEHKFVESVRKTPPRKPVETAAQRQAREKAEALKEVGRNLERVASKLGASPSISVEAYGPGGGGEVYMSYDHYVQSTYYQAWEAPEDTASDDAIVRVTITVNRSGKVTYSRINKTSGDPAVDRSVRRALERVPSLKPFPAGAKDNERAYNIDFNLKAKRLAG